MRKYLMSLMALLLFCVFIGTTSTAVEAANAPAACSEGQKTLVLHWYRFDGAYDNAGIHLWGTGGGTVDGATAKSGVDGFGAYFNICLGESPKTDQKGVNSIGAIPLELNEEGTQNWDTKATDGGKDLIIDVSYLYTEITPEEGEAYTPDTLHVFFVDKGAEVLELPNYSSELNYVFTLYGDKDSRYDSWGLYTWQTGTNGDAPGWGDFLSFGGTSYTTTNHFPLKLGAIAVDDDASDEIGFIISNGTDKAWTGDMFVDVTDLKEEGQQIKFLYYYSGVGEFKSHEDFFAEVNDYKFIFKFNPFNSNPDKSKNETAGTYAMSSNAIKVEFNQEVKVRVENEQGEYVDNTDFSVDYFTLKDSTGTEYEIVVNYVDAVLATKEFVITFKDENFKLDHTKTYTLYYDNGKEDTDLSQQKAEIVVDLDKEAPVIELITGESVIEIDQYAEFSFPDYAAKDNRDGDITARVYVPDGKGSLDTGKAGDQKITLAVTDDWGHLTEFDITVRVKAVEVEEEKAGMSTGVLIGLIAGGVVVVGAAAFVIVASGKKSK